MSHWAQLCWAHLLGAATACSQEGAQKQGWLPEQRLG